MSLSWGKSVANFRGLVKKTTIDVEKANEKIIDDTGTVIRKTAARFSPVKTGLLRASWKKQGFGKGSKRQSVVTNDVFYAIYQEHGTIKIAPRRMLQRALIVGEKYRQRRLDALNRKLARDFNA